MRDHHTRAGDAKKPHRAVVPAGASPRHEIASANIGALLLSWQQKADPECFQRLVTAVTPLVERIARCALRRHGILDPTARDEALSLVLDHLRRLPGTHGERPVAPFVAPPQHQPEAGDPGEAYVVWLTRDRAYDLARSRRRHSRHALLFSQLDRTATYRLERSLAAQQTSAPQPLDDLCNRLRDAVKRLPPREKSVIELLLAGKSQTIIADTIQVCEGTVSRLRSRAIAALRDLLAD
ncbi:MAG: hypothetical protein RLZZ111_1582 [Planctomycetota bacterium]